MIWPLIQKPPCCQELQISRILGLNSIPDLRSTWTNQKPTFVKQRRVICHLKDRVIVFQKTYLSILQTEVFTPTYQFPTPCLPPIRANGWDVLSDEQANKCLPQPTTNFVTLWIQPTNQVGHERRCYSRKNIGHVQSVQQQHATTHGPIIYSLSAS